ncbi:hypothetical protein [Aphanothece sacrum]|uniref:Uncharacterized protein n=1 Tax=Aphanothece sacrum FPU1 TaxID=1920663 RepID=A0A401IJK2_APHSA|nr:hypothetical protein [Aphanothece sacrum]GBF81404.1 hypothetical protein AsFPU1_2817 [Aphanothece sacrum FPU1]GBF85405.1 hypothetical protein AsFPU3_2464 [Aphanothece sacrum FPU3]
MIQLFAFMKEVKYPLWNLNSISLIPVILLLFFAASLGMVWQIFHSHTLTEKILAFSLFLASIEQGRMAKVDLDQIVQVKQHIEDSRLTHFSLVTITTIIVELMGFFCAFFLPYWGTLIIILSLAGFNLFAGIRLHPNEEIMIEPWGVLPRLPILLADGLGLVLVSLAMLPFTPLVMVLLLLTIFLIYGWIKYI